MRHSFGPDIVSLTEKFLMARNFFWIFTENNPAQGTGKNLICPEAKGLKDRLPNFITSTYWELLLGWYFVSRLDLVISNLKINRWRHDLSNGTAHAWLVLIKTFKTIHRKGINDSRFGSSQWVCGGKEPQTHSRNRVYFQLSLPFFKNV